MIKLVFSDLDGTLLDKHGMVSEKNKRVISNLKELGISTFAASARGPRSVVRISKTAGLGPLAICANGAIAYDVENDRILHESRLPKNDSHDVVAAVRRLFPQAIMAGELLNDLYVEDRFFDASVEGFDFTCVDDVTNYLSDGMTKIIARVPNVTAETLHGQLYGLLGEIADVTVSGPDWIEFAPFNVSKASGVRYICDLLNLDVSEVAAIGDQRNDLSMLSIVGYPFAVANAHPEILELGYQVVPHHNKSGFSHIFDKIVAHSHFVRTHNEV